MSGVKISLQHGHQSNQSSTKAKEPTDTGKTTRLFVELSQRRSALLGSHLIDVSYSRRRSQVGRYIANPSIILMRVKSQISSRSTGKAKQSKAESLQFLFISIDATHLQITNTNTKKKKETNSRSSSCLPNRLSYAIVLHRWMTHIKKTTFHLANSSPPRPTPRHASHPFISSKPRSSPRVQFPPRQQQQQQQQ